MNVYRISKNRYYLQWRDDILFSNIREIIEFLIKKDIDVKEIEFGFIDMISNSNNMMHFGITNKYLFSNSVD